MKPIYSIHFPNKSLSTVVRTQNSRCAKMPSKKKPPKDTQMGHFVKYAKIKATNIVKRASTIAIPQNRYLCAPVPGSPKMFLYLQSGFSIRDRISNVTIYYALSNGS